MAAEDPHADAPVHTHLLFSMRRVLKLVLESAETKV